MCAKKSFNNKTVFEEKYDLYGDMLYRLGIIYFGSGNDNQMCQEAISEAFLWLLTRKKSFKNSEKEKLELIRHMVLICESKSRRKSKRVPGLEKETSEGAPSYSEYIGMLEAAYRLPIKYRPVVHLALYENLDVRHISKMLSIPRPIVKKLLAKGMGLMEMVLEKELNKDYYCSMLNKVQPSYDIKENIFLYISEECNHVKPYLSAMQKGKAAFIAIAVIAFSMAFIRLYPQVKTAILIKYAFMNGTIHSVPIGDICAMHGDGILIGYSENGYQGYTVGKNSVEQLETKYILKTLDFRGIPFNVEFYYCIKDGHLAVMSLLDRCEIRADISPINGSTDSVLVTLHYCDYNNDYNSFVYPLIMDLNTLSTTDFLSGCKISEIGIVTGITVNDSLSGAIAVTREGDLYYCDVKNPSINQIVSLEGNSLCSLDFIGFCSDDTALYIIYTLRGNGEAYNQSFYKYSISSNTIRKCCEFDSSSDKQLLYFSSNSVLLGDFDNTYSIVDIRTGVSTNIPPMQEDDTNPIILPSPDERYVLFGYCASNLFRLDVKRIYIYDTIAKETSILDLSDYKGMSFSILSWYDNSHITLLKQDITPDNAGSISPEDENESTLWIFDINKLK